MGTLPILKPREVVRVLERMGFIQIRQRGSHRQFRHSDGRQTTVPDHGSRDLSPIILRQIIKDIRSTPDVPGACRVRAPSRVGGIARSRDMRRDAYPDNIGLFHLASEVCASRTSSQHRVVI